MPPVNQSFFDKLLPRENKRAVNHGRVMEQSNPSDSVSLMSTADPYNANSTRKIGQGREPSLLYGRIVEGIAYTHSYKVQLERGAGVLMCVPLIQTSANVVGARQLNTYSPNTGVIVMLMPHSVTGIILGALPDWSVSAQDALSDMISQGSNVGLYADQIHAVPFSLNGNGGIVEWSAGRPFDSVPIGEWGAVSDTGILVMSDSAHFQVRVDEETGVWGFYDDQLLRVGGHNMQTWAAGYENEMKDDQEEFDQVETWTPYLWEAHGTFAIDTPFTVVNSPQTTQVEELHYAAIEPIEDDLEPFHRLQVYRGYLGQAEKKVLVLPPEDAEGIEQYSNESIYLGVAEENWGLTGAISLRSSKAVIIAKRMLTPGPKRQKLAEDPTGDDDTNYKANGVYGDGPEHLVGDIPNPAGTLSITKTAAFLDYYAHVFNWLGEHPFHYHTLDWYLPDESDMPSASSMVNGIPTFSSLADAQYLDTPTPIQQYVDPRYQQINYYPNDSFIALLEDGGNIFADGWGCEYRTGNGSTWLSAPGDIHLCAGKDVYIHAGRNFVAKANDSVDLSANKGDFRAKAELQAYILGGNNGCGGVLIESGTEQVAFKVDDSNELEVVGGIILRAKLGAIYALATQMTFELTNEGGDDPSNQQFMIFDAGTGGEMIHHAKNMFRFVENGAQDVFDGGSSVNEYYADNALLDCKLRVGDDMFVEGCISSTGKIASADLVTGSDLKTWEEDDDGPDAINAEASDLDDRRDALQTWEADATEDITWLQDNTDCREIEFFFRSSEQCGTTDWIFPELRWHQMARISGNTADFWTENEVDSELSFAATSMPPPGIDTWANDEDYLQEDLNLFDYTTNYDVDRGALYETPTYADATMVTLDGNFPIIVNPS